MSAELALWSWSATLAFAAAQGTASLALGRVRALRLPTLGPSGLERSAALSRHTWLRALDPLVRWLAALIALGPFGRARRWLDRRCVRAGGALGLCSDEWLALALLSAAAAASLSACSLHVLELAVVWPVAACAALGAGWPIEHLRSRGAARTRRIAHELPATIDLISLCMGAGFDFAGALTAVAHDAGDPRSPLVLELRCVLRDLALGDTRARALAALAERVPAQVVHDFTAAAIQAERMGNPLREAIEIQAQTMRMRRSVSAEEAAARAGVLLAFPMLLLLAAIMLLMLGPFLVKGVAF